MSKKSIRIMLAYVGVLTGAGIASGQEILQYFVSLGIPGLIGIGILAILHILFGGILLQLGSMYLATDHSDVFDQITNKYIAKFMDLGLIFTCFVMGFVMIAGAGSNLNQAFGVDKWVGQLICTILIIGVGVLDFDKVSKIIGSFTPVIVALVVIGAFYTFLNTSPNWEHLNNVATSLPSNFKSVPISVLNDFGLCLMSSVSMGFVLGGEELNPSEAGLGGLLGGAIAGVLGILVAFTVFIKVDQVGQLEIPMLSIIQDINPFLGLLMAITIFAMIFNTAISLFYALARRFSNGEDRNFRIVLIVITLLAFALSFGGFKELIATFYPIIGYIGMVMMVILVTAWFKDRQSIKYENYKRLGINHYMRKKVDANEDFSKEDKKRLDKLIDRSNIDNTQMQETAEEYVQRDIDNEE